MRLLAILTLLIFLSESAIMALLHRYPNLPLLTEALVDSFLLVVIVSPSLGLLMFRPLVLHIREREQAEGSLQMERDTLEGILDSNPNLMLIRDGNAVIRLANQALARFYGVPVERLVGTSQPDLHAAAGMDLASLEKSLREDREVIEFAEPRYTVEPQPYPDGSVRWHRTSKAPVTLGDGRRCVQVISEDITERVKAEEALREAHDDLERRVEERTADLIRANELLKRVIDERTRAEEQIRASREQLRNLTARLESLREKERTRISREIHDELGQSLTALRLDLSLTGRRMRTDGLGLYCRKVESMIRLVDTVLGAVKTISTELRPGVLDELGLTAALEWLAKDFEARTEIPCSVAIRPDCMRVDRETSTALFRIVQESLTNVVRHAAAGRVEVRLEERDGRLVLEVRDAGIGITKEQVSDPRSLGLTGIRERVRALGGEVEFRGVAGRGTTVRVSLPAAAAEIRC